jgi:site-specific DNA-cytosine methylase
MNDGLNVLSLFDGMSCGRLALERCDLKIKKYFSSEIDKYAIKVAQHNFPDNILPFELDGDNIIGYNFGLNENTPPIYK